MTYTEITIQTPGDEPLRERLMAALLDIGCDSFMEAENILAAYIPSALFSESQLREVLSGFRGKAVFLKSEILPDQNWNAIWESSYEPVIVEGKCMVRAPFHEKQAGVDYDIVIQPKMSFGTAHHETTYLMLQMILDGDFGSKKVLDMGAGTAVLGIFAAMKGASQVVAIDNDEWAYNNAIENVQLNGLQNLDCILGNASSIPRKDFDVLLANINRNILLEDIRKYHQHLNMGAIVYLSGFYEKDLPAIQSEAEIYGWKLSSYKIRNDWVAAKFQVGSP